MSDLVPLPGVRLETYIGPHQDKHALTVKHIREVHDGGEACRSCLGVIAELKRKKGKA